jgi:hypothetical protein
MTKEAQSEPVGVLPTPCSGAAKVAKSAVRFVVAGRVAPKPLVDATAGKDFWTGDSRSLSSCACILASSLPSAVRGLD